MRNIGERLEEARKRKGVSIREAAEAAKIRSDYPHKFESNRFDLNLADIYVRGFLRNYAHVLKLPAEKSSTISPPSAAARPAPASLAAKFTAAWKSHRRLRR